MHEPFEVLPREDSMYSSPDKYDCQNIAPDSFLTVPRSSSVGVSNEKRRRPPSRRVSRLKEAKTYKRTRKMSEVIQLGNEEIPQRENNQFTPCFDCQCYLPPRAHHCRRCGRCVLRRDHHCIWLGKCIGYKNYKYFILLLHYQTLFLLLALLETGMQYYNVVNKYMIVYTVFFAVSIPEFVLVIALCIFHTRLLMINMTSLERVKHPKQV